MAGSSARARANSASLRGEREVRELEQLVLERGAPRIRVQVEAGASEPKTVEVPFDFVRWRGGTQIVPADGSQALKDRSNNELIRAVAKGHLWWNQLLAGNAKTVAEVAKRARVTTRYARRIIRTSFLAPDIVEAIIDGRQPADLSVLQLRRPPVDWAEQRQLLGFAQTA